MRNFKHIHESKEEQEYRHLSWTVCRYIYLNKDLYNDMKCKFVYDYILQYFVFFYNLYNDNANYNVNSFEEMFQREINDKSSIIDVSREDVMCFVESFEANKMLLSTDIRILNDCFRLS